jgi:hypothetical protein
MKVLNLENGELTGKGMRECYLLGNSIRDRYINNTSPFYINSISSSYQSLDYKFYSSQVRRTIHSAWVKKKK